MSIIDNARKLRAAMTKCAIALDDATASTVPEMFPRLNGNGKLMEYGTRINWNGTVKKAAVDLWDTTENNPDNSPTIWVDLAYKDGYRIIPETITVTTAFSDGEYGWWGDTMYRSKVDDNVYNPEQYEQNWEAVTT